MTQLLTPRQAEELHKSIIAYLSVNNLSDSAAALRQDTNLSEAVFDHATAKKYEGLLEKKWTGVVRLQKKIFELESRNAALQTELDTAAPLSRRHHDPLTWLPKSPPRLVLESHREAITSVAFHPVFSWLASASLDHTIKIWDWETGELERTIKGHTHTVLDIDFGGPPAAILLASCSNDLTIKLWDPSDNFKNTRTLPGHDHSVSAIRFIPSGAAGAPSSNALVSASRDLTLKIWDLSTGYCLKTLRGHTEWIRVVCPSSDGRFLLSGSDDFTARLWDLSMSEPETKLTFIGHEHRIECCAFAPPAAYPYLAVLAGLKRPPPASNGAEYMVTAGRDKTIRLWDARGTCLRVLVGHDNWVCGLVFHPAGKFLLSASDDKTVRCWDLTQDARCIRVIKEDHTHFVSCIRWAPTIPRSTATSTTTTNGASTADVPSSPAANGVPPRPQTTAQALSDVQIRCMIATGSVDNKVRIYAA